LTLIKKYDIIIKKNIFFYYYFILFDFKKILCYNIYTKDIKESDIMFDVNDILSQLKDGRSIEDIADDFSVVLNAAAKQKAKEEEAKAEKEKAADYLIQNFIGFIKEFYPDVELSKDEPVTGAELIKTLDSLFSIYGSIKTSLDKLANGGEATINYAVNWDDSVDSIFNTINNTFSDTDPLTKFLDVNGLL
jgi:hypothetical protein